MFTSYYEFIASSFYPGGFLIPWLRRFYKHLQSPNVWFDISFLSLQSHVYFTCNQFEGIKWHLKYTYILEKDPPQKLFIWVCVLINTFKQKTVQANKTINKNGQKWQLEIQPALAPFLLIAAIAN